jgi:hypothetical protein
MLISYLQILKMRMLGMLYMTFLTVLLQGFGAVLLQFIFASFSILTEPLKMIAGWKQKQP